MSSAIEEIDLTEETSNKKPLRRWKNNENKKDVKKKEEDDDDDNNDTIILCLKCPLSFTKQCNYNKHLKYAHSIMDETILNETQSSLLNNFNTNINSLDDREKVFECSQCSKTFVRQSNLSRHLEIHAIHQSFTCIKCNTEFFDEPSLNEHKSTHIECQDQSKPIQIEKKGLLYCDICNRNFFYESALEKHKELHLTKQPLFVCSHCPQKFFQKTNLVQHEYTHTRPLHSCYICNKTFNKVYHLKSHLRLHGKSGYTLNCDQCGKGFKSKTSLEVHIKNHTKILRYKCKGCEAEFSNKTTFVRHMQIKINNSTKYRCEYCGKLCCHKKNLDKHLTTHSIGNISFKCNKCNQTFADKFQFARHMYSHVAGGRRYTCNSCNAVFTSEINLYRHRSSDDGSELKCVLCKRTFNCTRSLKRHYCIVENPVNKKIYELDDRFIDSYAEEILEASTYKMPPSKIKHRDHTYALQSWPIKPYKCKKCGRHFCRLVNLEKHIQEIHPFYLSAESSEENSENEIKDTNKIELIVPKITSVTSLNEDNKGLLFFSDDNITHPIVESDNELVDPLLIEDQQSHREMDMGIKDSQESKINKNIVKIENYPSIHEVDVIDIKQEIIDYESS